MKKKAVIAAILSAVAIVGAAVVYFFILPASVTVAPVVERDIVETLVATGQVQPRSRSELSAQVAGRVDEVLFEEGDTVVAGEELLRLDDEEAEASYEQARSGVEAARARLESVTGGSAPTAVQDLRKASLAYEAAVEDLERGRHLFEGGVLSRADLDEIERRVERTAAEVEQAETAVEESTPEGSAYAEAAAGLGQARAQRDLAGLRLQHHTLRAPAVGEILTRSVEPGVNIQPGGPVATLAIDGPIELRIDPDERELADLQPGQPAVVAADAFADRPFEATVDRLTPSVDRERGTIGVYLRVEDPPAFLRSDMTVSVEVIVGRAADALVVPRLAVRDLATDEPFVLLVEDSRVARRAVSAGLVSSAFVEISGGLEAGEEVVTDATISTGDRVRDQKRRDIDSFDADTDSQGSSQLDAPGAL